ncbi:MAG: translation initiation factor IF-2 [Patescibacteria group bacterium]
MSRIIEIDQSITVSTLAEQLELPAASLVSELFKNGIMITLNEKIDYDTASILISELGIDVELKQKEQDVPVPKKDEDREGAVLADRPPVVAIMGHVDHGKTSLLDKIRDSKVADGEAGGITQHISAYQIEHKNRLVTFLDTPGHEAFAAIREHGAALTDVVVIVVAADDGIKPQTIEAIRFANKAGVKLIIAANKMDKDAADLNRVKQGLAEQELLPEDWGGQTTVMPVSAKTGEGIDELIDMILLVSDVEELKADTRGPAAGLIIEAHMQKGLGPVAVALVNDGVLSRGDFLVAGSSYGKARVLKDSNGAEVQQATASTPVTISGLKSLPEFGDDFHVVGSEKEAKKLASSYSNSQGARSSGMTSTEMLRIISKRTSVDELNILLKADVQGSLTSVSDSVKGIDTNEVSTRIVGSGIGAVGESDIRTAAAAGATIYCFNVSVPAQTIRLATQHDVEIKSYTVIYELIDDIKAKLEDLLSPEDITTELGTLKIKGIFNTTKTEVICGGELLKGKLTLPAKARVTRDKKQIAEAEVGNLKKGPTDTHEVLEGEMCGLTLVTESKLTLEEGDRLELYRVETIERSL